MLSLKGPVHSSTVSNVIAGTRGWIAVVVSSEISYAAECSRVVVVVVVNATANICRKIHRLVIDSAHKRTAMNGVPIVIAVTMVQ